MKKPIINKIISATVVAIIVVATFALPAFAYGGYTSSEEGFDLVQDFVTPGIPINLVTQNAVTTSLWAFNNIFDTVHEGGGMTMQNQLLTTWIYDNDQSGLTWQSETHNYVHDIQLPLPENVYQAPVFYEPLPSDIFGETFMVPLDPVITTQSNAEIWATDFVFNSYELRDTSLRYNYHVNYTHAQEVFKFGYGCMAVVRPFNKTDIRYNVRVEVYNAFQDPVGGYNLVNAEVRWSDLASAIDVEMQRAGYDAQSEYFVEYLELFPVAELVSGSFVRLGNVFHINGDYWRVDNCISRELYDEIQVYYTHYEGGQPVDRVDFGDPIKNSVNSILKIELFQVPVGEGTVSFTLGTIILMIFTFGLIGILIKWLT